MRTVRTRAHSAALVGIVGLVPTWGNRSDAKPPLPFPYPLITEVLYAVPTGDEGDADRDGERSAVGDEFIELYNPHDRPIQLRGYALCDGTPKDAYDKKEPNSKGGGTRTKTGPAPKPNNQPAKDAGKDRTSKPDDAKGNESKTSLRFVFPEFELKPGEVVVLFNGHEQKIPGPVGTREHAPASKNEKFGNGWVFTMGVESRFVAFNNKGDCVALYDPSGALIEVVTWGKPNKEPPTGAALTEKAPEAKGSVQRVGLTSKLVEHEEMRWSPEGGRELFSPGVFDPSFTPVPRGKGTNGKDAAEPKSKPVKTKSPAESPADPTRK